MRAVVAALLANFGIAVSKFVGFLVTGSTAMLAEAVHSVADPGNQALLLFGKRQAGRPADPAHPFGYGRNRYFYGFVVALVLFSLGSLFAIYGGVRKVAHPHGLDSPAVAIGILGVAIVLEALSFRTAVHESNRVRAGNSWVAFIRRSKAPELPVVLLEDFAALVGLVFAMGGVVAATVTGDARWDGAGSIAIGALLGVVATVLAVEMKSLLIGESAEPATVADIAAALVDGTTITRIIHLRTMHLGPEELLVAAKVALAPGLSMAQVAAAIDDAEVRVRARVPIARPMYLEPDLYRDLAGESTS
jgi:cation diffusion facilitator family transporter